VKFFVTILGRDIAVEIDGDRVLVEGREAHAHLSPVPGGPLRHLLFGRESRTVVMERRGPGEWLLGLAGMRYEVSVVDERTRHLQRLTESGGRRGGQLTLRAPMPGLVVRILAAPGQTVDVGQGLVVLEAMKMENELRATARGVVRAVQVSEGQAVEKGALLVEFETPAGS
jgi:biotin carboxyl carrier protein